MTSSFDPGSRPVPPARIIGRGFTAAHGALLGVLWLFLLQVPFQVVTALMQVSPFQPTPGHNAGPMQLLLGLVFAIGAFVLTVIVFLLFPLVQGGILGQVRDRLETPHLPPGRFGRYARAYYDRLLGSQALFLVLALCIMLPVMFFAMSVAFDEMSKTVAPDGGPTTTPQQINRAMFSDRGLIVGMFLAGLMASALWIVYWVANSIVVAEGERVIASWVKSLLFCRTKLAAVAVVWLISVGVGILMTPISLIGQLGFVTNPVVLAVLAVLYSGLVAYWGVLLAGICLSLYLARRPTVEAPESVDVVPM
jgi:hypothetical protein